jgi:hypothetical protein
VGQKPMIQLTAKINILSSENSELYVNSYNMTRNNVSLSLTDFIGKKRNAKNIFILGSNKLGDGSSLSNGVDYYIGNILSDENGMFSKEQYIEITDSNSRVTNLFISFDNINNMHPKSIVVDGIEYFSNDSTFLVNIKQNRTHIISINNWNAPHKPIVITGIYADYSIEINKKNVIKIESSIFDRSDLKFPDFGIISNTGNIEFNDLNGEIANFFNNRLLEKSLDCEIILENTNVVGAEEKVSIMKTDEWYYDNDNMLVRLSIKDDLEEWQEVNVDKIDYDPRKPNAKSCKWYYYHLWNLTPAKYNMISFEELDKKTKFILESTFIQYPLLESSNLWREWTKLCQVCQLHIYKNKNITVCKYNDGN